MKLSARAKNHRTICAVAGKIFCDEHLELYLSFESRLLHVHIPVRNTHRVDVSN
jgi:hypothetical protein